MTEEFIIVARDSVPQEFERTEQTEFQRTQTVVFEKDDFVRVFSEVKPNGA
jgi:hypothetical protein